MKKRDRKDHRVVNLSDRLTSLVLGPTVKHLSLTFAQKPVTWRLKADPFAILHASECMLQ